MDEDNEGGKFDSIGDFKKKSTRTVRNEYNNNNNDYRRSLYTDDPIAHAGPTSPVKDNPNHVHPRSS